MMISAFSFLRNGSKLYYPILESIRSALPLVDEFVIAMGDSDPDDDTREQIESLGSDKIRFIDTVWDLDAFPNGTEYAHQTDIAKSHCKGDWLLYLQGDEVLHEDDLPGLRAQCEKWLDHPEVDGMIFDYLHFWGDYGHVQKSHAWYKREIRMLKNDPEIHSRNDAQSFRRVPDFDGLSYRQKAGTQKLNCVYSYAKIFHYGWVRPPDFMERKQTHFHDWHQEGDGRTQGVRQVTNRFDYGAMGRIPLFLGTHPSVMTQRIAAMDWADELYERAPVGHKPAMQRHDRLKYRLISWLENTFFRGRHLFASEHFILVGDNQSVGKASK
ncbi:MAG: hypothetical protein HOM34_03085 [Planctomycetes bacterium]|jgi:hypothetical protein|nr:hypothetical protein [Planctomycetota bacterium]MBT4028728.1 hypothetical protein [Planctomycetota bacterium]MBT4560228.1 hypothetical protein [Planctomycetota bacterium]MBT5119691.1 hypothetical protein [Planctomycetota bacterium]MBT7011842.1 hypothetical protein [Planctomycetota bacterium]